ncbi:MAG: GNAT family N-acetyltransferase [Candidatus Peribacteraceae bacterium]
MLIFSPPADFESGIIARLLKEGYAGVKPTLSEKEWKKLVKTFEDFDQEVFSNIHVARCTFITVLDGIPIGLGSYDPRKRPAYGLVGHNVVLPSVQGKKFGKAQLLEILNRMRAMGIRKARVSTGDHAFSIPAQKNYESAGFRKTRRFIDKNWSFGQIEYEMILID